MRRALLVVLLACAALLNGSAAHAASYPTPTGYVNDFTKTLSSGTVATLNQELAAFEASTTNQISVAVVPSLEGDYIEHYAVKLFEAWGVGTKEKDNGVLLLIAVEDRELRIEVGYGLEGALTDSTAQAIITNEITPAFKAGNYDAGVVAGVRAIMAATRGEYISRESGIPTDPIEILQVLLIVVMFLGSFLGRSKSWWLGGVFGAVAGGGFWLHLGLALINGLILLGALTVTGLLIDLIFSKLYQRAVEHQQKFGGPMTFWGGGSGGRGGGFGGFGGGSSGGGGASGRW